jgi:peptide/nickel transport system substrate-binding protein
MADFMKKHLLTSMMIPLFILSACIGRQTQPPPQTSQTAPPIQNDSETALPILDETPASLLTVCMGAEPNTLYPLGELNQAARTVLKAVYNGPVDFVSYEYQPVIFSMLPSLENGDAQIDRVQVQAGSQVVDADGNLVSLALGTRIRPASCRSDDCIITYDGGAPVDMDQMIVTFRLRPDLTWSDGVPITADDSQYSHQLHADANPADYLIQRTQTYELADPQTLQWWGVPGFLDPTYFMNFWMPAPRHLWANFPANDLAKADFASRTPTGWGPYMIDEWLSGDRITLKKNPYYFRAADGYPKVETLVFRFIPDPAAAISEMVAGRCDILDPTINLDQHVNILQEMQTAGQAQFFTATGMTMEWLGFGLLPASYDDGYSILSDRQDFFTDPHTRQGIAYCLNRQAVTDHVLFGLTSVPTTYVPNDHPTFDPGIAAIPYDPQVGISFLQLAGWQDVDKDPTTPLRAVNVKNVAYNTPLQLTYHVTPSAQRRQAAEIFKTSLAECGIALDVRFLTPNDLYAAGPVGPLFGRSFDLAQFALGVEGFDPACDWFASDEIPTAENGWRGMNITGFQSVEYDAACREAQRSLWGEQAYVTAHRRTQVILADALPAIPLYHRLHIAAARPEVCRFDLDATANPLWNLESIGVGETCQN